MTEFFKQFADASAYARECAWRSEQVVSVVQLAGALPEEEHWAVQPVDEDPNSWLRLLEQSDVPVESHSIDAFLEYEVANDPIRSNGLCAVK